ncbi:dihydrolipoyl dehydrogenase [Cellvibrio sp. NN19]|uniref:dihydrolipoyl dehydrogenase n=1 Tax=Cellvibrio chitinivorans TaxID=3102792 RepID=UPI002B416E86|nr:dihydrolipoyl dehydrogenase [Cellvibrio sp. NN19]
MQQTIQKRQVDVAIIGAGTAGLSAYNAAKHYTDNLLLIEAKTFGTTCARVGCMPSKLLIAAADYAHHGKSGDVFGVTYAAPEINGVAVMERVRRERDRFVASVIKTVDEFPPENKLLGRAKFQSRSVLIVTQQDGTEIEVSAKRIVIATGSSPVIPDSLKAAAPHLVVSDDVFEWRDLPKSVAIFGPGVIGLELGQAMSRLGVRVAVFGKSGALAAIKDPSICEYADMEFNREFYLDLKANIEDIQSEKDGVAIRYAHRQKGVITEKFDYVLATTGRRPNIDGLNIESADLSLNNDGIPYYNRYTGQCGSSPIYIAGDASSDVPLLHEAVDEGRIAGGNAARTLRNPDDIRAGVRRTPLSVVFTDPQIASVGQSLEEIRRGCTDCYAIGEVSYEKQGRAQVINKNRGLLRIYAEQGTGLLLGAEMFGPAAEHIAHQLAWVIQLRLTVQQVLDLPFYHPVLEEGVRTALRDLNRKLRLGVISENTCLDCGPGA